MKTLNFFAEDDRLAKLSKLGDQLEKLDRVMDWKIFEPLLKGVFAKETKGAGGRPPYDYVMMNWIFWRSFHSKTCTLKRKFCRHPSFPNPATISKGL